MTAPETTPRERSARFAFFRMMLAAMVVMAAVAFPFFEVWRNHPPDADKKWFWLFCGVIFSACVYPETKGWLRDLGRLRRSDTDEHKIRGPH